MKLSNMIPYDYERKCDIAGHPEVAESSFFFNA